MHGSRGAWAVGWLVGGAFALAAAGSAAAREEVILRCEVLDDLGAIVRTPDAPPMLVALDPERGTGRFGVSTGRLRTSPERYALSWSVDGAEFLLSVDRATGSATFNIIVPAPAQSVRIPLYCDRGRPRL